MPRIFSFSQEKMMNDRVSDLARPDVPDRDRRLGGVVVSVELNALIDGRLA
jgi:hypothetical protein